MALEATRTEEGHSLPGVLAGWTGFLLISGACTRWAFDVGTRAQHIYLAHAAFGVLVLVPALWALLGRIPAGARGAGRGTAQWLLALSAILAAGTGAWLCLRGSTAGPSAGRDAHLACAAAVLLMWLAAVVMGRGCAGRGRAAAAFLVPCGVAVVTAWLWPVESMEMPFPEKYFRKDAPFLPGRAKTAHGGAVKLEALATGHQCGECHRAIHDQWLSSSHRNSTVSKWYSAQLKLRMDTADARGFAGARFCGTCHEPIVTLSGNLDDHGLGPDYPDNRDQGVTCVACHRAVTARDTIGNGSYVHAALQPYLFQTSPSPAAAWVGRALLQGKPEAHAAGLMRPLMEKSELCATCHQVFFKTLYGKLFQVQNDYDTWKASAYNRGPGHPKTRTCQDCHMPLVKADDPAAKDGKVHSHRFVGANTARPFQVGDREHLARTEEFLQQACFLSLKVPPGATPGTTATLQVVVTNVNVGHSFPGGTTDMVDCWLEVLVSDGSGRRLLESGLVAPGTLQVDPKAHFYRTYPMNVYGEHLFRRDLWYTHRVTEVNLIGPGKSDVVAYSFAVPSDSKGPLKAKARLRFRRSHQKFTDYAFPEKRMELPITDLADDERKVPLGSSISDPSGLPGGGLLRPAAEHDEGSGG